MKPFFSKLKRPRFLLPALGGGLIFVFLAGILINGPGFRLLGPRTLSSIGAKHGFATEMELSGSLLGGFTLKNLILKRAPDQFVSIGEISIDYHRMELLRRPMKLAWLKRLAIRDVEVILDLPEKPASKGETPGESSSDRRPLDLWNLLETNFDLSNVNIKLRKAGEKSFEVKRLNARLDGEKQGLISCGELSLPGLPVASDVNIPVIFGKDSLSLKTNIPELGVEIPVVTLSRSPQYLAGRLKIGGGALRFEASNLASISLVMEQSIDLSAIPLDYDLKGAIRTLHFKVASEPHWSVDGELDASDLGFEKYDLARAKLDWKGDQVSLKADRNGGKIDLSAHYPLSRVTDPGELGKLPATVAGTIGLTEVETVLGDFGIDLPLAGAIQAELKQVTLSPEAGRAEAGEVSIQSSNLSWKNQPFKRTSLQAKIAEDGDQIDIGGDFFLDETNRAAIKAVLSQKSLEYGGAASARIRPESWLASLAGETALTWKGTGNLRTNRHKGDAEMRLTSFRYQDGHPISGTSKLSYEGSNLSLSELNLTCGDARLTGKASILDDRIEVEKLSLIRDGRERLSLSGNLPVNPKNDTGNVDLIGNIRDLDPNDVARFFRKELPLRGHLNGSLTANGALQNLDAKSEFVFFPEASRAGTQPKMRIHADFRGDVTAPKTWDPSVDAVIAGLEVGDTMMEDFLVKIVRGIDQSILATVSLDQSGAALRAQGDFALAKAATIEDLKRIPLSAKLDLSIPDMAKLRKDFPLPAWKNLPLEGDLRAKLSDIVLSGGSIVAGKAAIRADALGIKGQTFETFQIDGHINAPDQLAAKVDVALDARARANGRFNIHLKEKHYGGSFDLAAAIDSGGKLANLFAGSPAAKLFPGETQASWAGSGAIDEKKHTGDLVINAKRIRLADGAVPLDVNLVGNYSETSADFPNLSIKSTGATLTGRLHWKESRLRLVGLKGVADGRPFLAGSIDLPFEPGKFVPEEWFSRNDPVAVDLKLDDAPLETLSRWFVAKAPLLATVASNLNVSGSPAEPKMDFQLRANGIQVPNERPIDVGTLDFQATGTDGLCQLAGSFQHPQINPLHIRGRHPFHPGAWATGKRKFADEKLEATVKMNQSSLAFLATQIPGIEKVVGTAALDARVGGTLARPELDGSGFVDLDQLKFEDRNAPDIKQMDTVLRLSNNRVRLEKLYAIVAGGVLEAAGQATFGSGKEPVIDLAIRGSDVLVTRTPELNIRTDADLVLRGPWSKVAISGELGLINSRYYKNIDLFPSNFPSFRIGRAPKPTPVPRGGGKAKPDLDIGVRAKPFADWTTHLHIHTKDPFLVRGNTVNAAARGDIRITGPLSRPVPNGFIQLEEGKVTLPFSTVGVEFGRITFDEKNRFNGALEFKARAKADNYNINLFVHDRLLSPNYVITSVPPLPADDIVTLLATGATRSDINAEGITQMAASKAATTLLKNIRQTNSANNRDPTLLDDLRERTELELGGVNPTTGTQTFGGKIRLWKKLFFVGDMDRENDYRALLKYVFSFE